MTTSWRNTEEGFKQSEKPTIENFASIPMFDVLYNDKIIEGMNKCEPFNMFCDDYFQNVKRFKGFSGLNDLGNKIKSYLVKFMNPVDQLDKWIDESILNILKIYINSSLENCNGETPPVNTIAPSFTWIERFTNMQEGFNIKTADVSGTILNLQKNHPNIHPEKLAQYYIQELNKRYGDLKGNVKQNDLFQFNNDMDMNQLTNPKVIEKIQGIPSPIPIPKPVSFEEYMEKYSRFSFSTDASISYYPFLDMYFPLPSTKSPANSSAGSPLAYFETLLQNDFKNKTNHATEEFTNSRTNIAELPKNDENVHFIFSINIKKNEKQSIPNYLKSIVLYLSFVFINNKKIPDATFIDILPKIATVYVNMITYVEYLKYAKLNQYLTKEEVAIFNHIFYCCLNQIGDNSNPFDGSNKYSLQTQYFNDENNIIPFIITLCSHITDRMQIVFNDMNAWYSADLIEKYPVINSILMNVSSKKVVLTEFIHTVTPLENIVEYYNIDFTSYISLQECKSKNDAILKQFKQYSYAIKQELYRILMIPIILVIVYNFYYMFLFKDCFGYAKTVNNDKYVYEKTCNNGCFFPQFPDWEMNFHNMENHRTDFIFEFLFKPTKWMYVFLNAAKRIFYNNGLFSFLPSYYPYICFLAMFVVVYSIINKSGGKLLNIIFSLFKLTNPTIQIGGLNVNLMATVIVWLSFARSFLKGIGVAADFENPTDNTPKQPSWIEWILDSKGSGIIMIIKAICFIVYWIVRGMIISLTIPLSAFIFVIYCVWITLGSIMDYTDKSHSYSDKFEIIDRILYSKLYELPDDEWGKNTLKTLCFYAFYFLTEIIILFTLITSINKYQNMPMPTMGGESAASAAYGIKTLMTFIYMIFIILLVCWSVFKYYTQKSNMNDLYVFDHGEHRLNNLNCNEEITSKDRPENARESAEYTKFYNDNQDEILFFNKNKDSFISRIMYSDRLNSIFTKYYTVKTGHFVERPMAQKIVNSFVKMGKFFSDKINPPESYVTIKPETLFSNISNIFKK